jgi:hypothetical protein
VRKLTTAACEPLMLSGLYLSGVAARVEYGARYGVGRDLLIPSRPMCKFPLN